MIDPPGDGAAAFSEEGTNATLQGIRERYPALRFIRLVDPYQGDLALRALAAGAQAALVEPSRSAHPSSFAEDFIKFAEAFLACLQQAAAPPGRIRLGDFRERLAGLERLAKPSEISLSLLQLAASMFPRTLTLIVSGAAVVVERSIGLDGGRAVAPALKLQIPVEQPLGVRPVIDSGQSFYGQAHETRC